MAAIALLDAEILVGAIRMGWTSNKVQLEPKHEALDATVYASGGAKAYLAGLRETMCKVEGFYDSTPPETGALATDSEQFSQLGGAQVPVTVTPQGAALGTAYIFGARKTTMGLFGKVGDLHPFDTDLWGDGQIARGSLLHAANITETTSGTSGTAILGTVATGRNLFVSIHAVTLSGTTPSLTVTVQRDDNAPFSSPVTVATLGPISSIVSSAVSSSLTIVPGPITPDDRYRVTWTLTGTTPVARFGVAVGIA
jgi:hypothetical protein